MLNHLRIDAAPYGFRRSFAEWAYETGVSLAAIKACLCLAHSEPLESFLKWHFHYSVQVPVMEQWGRHVAPDRSAPA